MQTNAAGNHIPTKNLRTAVPNPKLQAEILIRFLLKESDLSFVILFVAEESVPDDPFSGDALNLSYFGGFVVAGRLFVVTEEVVPRGNEQVTDLKFNAHHDLKDSLSRFPRKAERIRVNGSTGTEAFATTGNGA
jgi:hypothetical protein